MKKKKPKLMITRESPEDRKKRVSNGIKYRPAVFENKKRQQKYKENYNEENL